MFIAQDPPHLEAMDEMKSLMTTPKAMQAWFKERQAEFEALPKTKASYQSTIITL